LAAGGGGDFTLDRASSYIGVLIDDLVTRGTEEPYRMFTSRAEYRLVLRADNADQRLTPRGIVLGCVSSARAEAFAAKAEALATARAVTQSLRLMPAQFQPYGLAVKADGVVRSAIDLLARPDVSFAKLCTIWPELSAVPAEIAEQIEIDGRYAGYLERQDADIRAFRHDESLTLPRDLDYETIGSLSTEIRQKLKAAQPENLGAAGRISGVTPAALVALLRYVRRGEAA
jgi:tRNA uridine 5-carboxymethylaminomethyl modification enzyme